MVRKLVYVVYTKQGSKLRKIKYGAISYEEMAYKIALTPYKKNNCSGYSVHGTQIGFEK